MSKWEEEFVKMFRNTRRLRKQTEQWRKNNKEESEMVSENLRRFRK